MSRSTRQLELSQLAVPTAESRVQPSPARLITTSTHTVQNTNAQNGQHVRIVIAATTLVFTVCGILFAFGVFQELYESMAQDASSPFYGASPAEIDLIGTLATSLMTIGAPYASAWTKRYHPRLVIWSGGIIFFLGYLLASFSKTLWQFELTQGVLVGIGTCLSYMPAVAVTPTWFTAHRGLAMGIVLSGTGIGGVVWAPVLHSMVTQVGFRNALRISAAIGLIFITAAGSVMEWEPTTLEIFEAETTSSSTAQGLFKIPLVNYRIARSRKFIAQALGAILQSAAYYTPVFFFASYARTLGYSTAAASNFIALSNATNAIGKIAIGHTADKVGRINTLLFTTAMSAVAALALWLPSCVSSTQSDGRALFIAFAIMYGIFASAYVALFPTTLIELFGVQNFASVNGLLYMVRGFATLIGTPTAGALIRGSTKAAGSSRYLNTSILVGVLLMTATLAVGWVRFEAVIDVVRDRRNKWRV